MKHLLLAVVISSLVITAGDQVLLVPPPTEEFVPYMLRTMGLMICGIWIYEACRQWKGL